MGKQHTVSPANTDLSRKIEGHFFGQSAKTAANICL